MRQRLATILKELNYGWKRSQSAPGWFSARMLGGQIYAIYMALLQLILLLEEQEDAKALSSRSALVPSESKPPEWTKEDLPFPFDARGNILFSALGTEILTMRGTGGDRFAAWAAESLNKSYWSMRESLRVTLTVDE